MSFFERYRAVGAMQVQNVDLVDAEPLRLGDDSFHQALVAVRTGGPRDGLCVDNKALLGASLEFAENGFGFLTLIVSGVTVRCVEMVDALGFNYVQERLSKFR